MSFLNKCKAVVSRPSISDYLLVALTAFNIWIFSKPLATDDLKIHAANELFIGQNWGNLNFYHSISIKNIGEKIGYITKIETLIKSKDSERTIFRRKMGAKYLYSNIDGSMPFSEIALNPNRGFSYEVQSFKEPSRFEEDSTTILQTLIINEFDAAERKPRLYPFASKSTEKKIHAFVSAGIKDFHEGEYEYIIQITKNDEKEPFFTKCYNFVIYQSNINLLKESIKSYYKLYSSLPYATYRRPNLRVSLNEVETPEFVNSLKKEME